MGKGGRVQRGQRGRTQDRQSDRQARRERKGNNGRGVQRGERGLLNAGQRRKFQRTVFENIEDLRKQEAAIAELKTREFLCPICGKRVEEIESAVTDKQSGLPAHFDCITNRLAEMEHLKDGENVVYIGQGTFAVMRYDNKDDPKMFHIVRKIEWENGGRDIPWRHEISSLFSQVL